MMQKNKILEKHSTNTPLTESSHTTAQKMTIATMFAGTGIH